MPRDHVAECRAWNTDHEHQVRAGHASFAAFSARLRATNGSAQLFPQAAAKYVSPDEIGYFGHALPPVLQQIIHTVWSQGIGWGVEHWLLPRDVTPSPPDGSLFAEDGDEAHTWQDFAPGWSVRSTCWLAALCPLCQPDWWDDPFSLGCLKRCALLIKEGRNGTYRSPQDPHPCCAHSSRGECAPLL